MSERPDLRTPDRATTSGNRDLTELARRARAAVSDADEAILLIQGVGRLDATESTVVLPDEQGRPIFWCSPQSPIAQAARHDRAALFTVPSSGLRLILAGRLGLVRSEQRDGEPLNVISLTPAQAWVELDDPRRSNVVARELPLALYSDPDAAELADRLEAIKQHTNLAHQPELRTFVARRHGAAAAEVAGVVLSRLDRDGFEVRWVDTAGAHGAAVSFGRPAHNPAQVVERLRDELCAQH
jgi:hypothetical protein